MAGMTRRAAGLGVAAGLCLAAGAGLAAGPQPVAKVLRLNGAAAVVRGDRRTALAVGAPLFESDTVETAADGRVALGMADGSTVTLGGDGRLALTAYALKADGRRGSGLLSLLSGLLRATVADGGGAPFAVRTETSVAAARSTDWTVEATPAGTAVFVIEGVVAVDAAAGAGSVGLTAGLGSDVAAGQAPTPPAPWGAARVERTLARLALR